MFTHEQYTHGGKATSAPQGSGKNVSFLVWWSWHIGRVFIINWWCFPLNTSHSYCVGAFIKKIDEYRYITLNQNVLVMLILLNTITKLISFFSYNYLTREFFVFIQSTFNSICVYSCLNNPKRRMISIMVLTFPCPDFVHRQLRFP